MRPRVPSRTEQVIGVQVRRQRALAGGAVTPRGHYTPRVARMAEKTAAAERSYALCVGVGGMASWECTVGCAVGVEVCGVGRSLLPPT